jgi:DNA-binding protein HU-beta
MLKSELVEVVAAKCGITASESEKFLNTLTHTIYEELRKGGVVKISGFGQFSVSHRESREGVNPRRPSERIIIPKLNTPKFKAGEALKAAVKL